jgi:hypothetical protein
VLTEHNLCENPFAESLEGVQDRRLRSARPAARLQDRLRGEASGESEYDRAEFELELRSTLA